MSSFEYAYAKALYSSCHASGQYQDWLVFLAKLDQLYKREDFQRFYSDPLVVNEKKCKLIHEALEDSSPLHKKLVDMLVARNKLDAVAAISKAFKTCLFEVSSIVDVPLKSAHTLKANQLKVIESFIKNRYKKDVNFIPSIDPSMTGIEFRVGSDVMNYTGLRLIDRAVSLLKIV